MKKLIGLFLSTVLMVVLSSAASAQSTCAHIGISGLSELEDNMLRMECQRMLTQRAAEKARNGGDSITPELTPERVQDWGAVAKDIAEAVGVMAKEVGVAVNDFIQSDAGKLAVLMLVWQMLGEYFMGILLGFVGIMFLTIVGMKILNMLRLDHYETITKQSRLRGERQVRIPVYTKWKDMPDSLNLWVIVLSGAILVGDFLLFVKMISG